MQPIANDGIRNGGAQALPGVAIRHCVPPKRRMIPDCNPKAGTPIYSWAE